MNIEISPKKVFTVLLVIISVLLLANSMGIIAKYFFHSDDTRFLGGLITMLDFDTENNIPTLYSTFILFVNSLLFLIIALSRKQNGTDYVAWLGLMFGFFYLSLDEILGIHERLDHMIRAVFDMSGVLYYAWVIPYGVIAAVVGVIYLPFLLKLPKKIRILFVVSGIVYILGAIGFEMLGGMQDEQFGEENLFYAVLYTFEELLEMLGASLFVYSLLAYMSEQSGHIVIDIRGKLL